MLGSMSETVQKEAKEDEAVFEKYMCFCKTDHVQSSLEGIQDKVPQLESNIKELEALKSQLKAELIQHKKERQDAKQAIESTHALREKEVAEYEKVTTEKKKNIAAMGKAIVALEKGSASGFLQTSTATLVEHLTSDMDMSVTHREVLNSFFAQRSDTDEDSPENDQIVGILKQMKSDMEKELAADVQGDEEAEKRYRSLVAARKKESLAAAQAIEDKQSRLGKLGVELQSNKEEYDDVSARVDEDSKFLADKKANCKKAEDNYETLKKTRNEELEALAETVKMLNDDDALELFKKTLPSPSLLQIRITSNQVRRQAVRMLHKSKHHHDPRLDLISMAIQGRKASFDRVIKMIEDLESLIKKEQADDDDKKEYCESEFDSVEDKLKALDQSVQDSEAAVKEEDSLVKSVLEDIVALKASIQELDRKVVEATALRKEEHELYMQTLTDSKAAKDLLLLATNRLNKFYNPKLYKPEPKEELSPDERIAASMEEPSLLQIKSRQSSRLPTAPEAVSAYKKSHESSGVMELMGILVADLDKELTASEVEEKDEQEGYEQFIEDSATKRTSDSKSIAQKERMQADIESDLVKLRAKTNARKKEALATSNVLGDLHKECDWLLANYAARKEARAGEKDSLVKAKYVLQGMDVSLVQTSRAVFYRKPAFHKM